MNLIPTMNGMASALTAWYSRINWGGCCWIAGEIAQRLAVLPGVTNVRATVLDDKHSCNTSVDAVRPNVKRAELVSDWNDNGITFHHVVVSFTWLGRDYKFDTDNGCFQSVSDSSYAYCSEMGDLTIDETIALSRDDSPMAWNRAFDRDMIPTLLDCIGDWFETLGVPKPPAPPTQIVTGFGLSVNRDSSIMMFNAYANGVECKQ